MRPGWSERSLGRLAAIPIEAGFDTIAEPDSALLPRYIRTTDISALDRLNPAKRVCVPADSPPSARLRRGDLLMTRSGSLGTSYLHDSDEEAFFAGYLVRFRARSDCASRFVAWWTQSKHHLDQVAVGATKSTIDNFSASKFSRLRLPVPPLAEQRAIAAYLDHEIAEIDALVSAQEGLIATLRERRAAVVDGSLGKPTIPLKATATVIDCLHVTAEFVHDSPLRVASVRQVVGHDELDLSEAKRTTPEFFERLRSEGRAPRSGDLLFIRNVSAGAVALVGDDVDFAVGQETVIVRPNAGVDARCLLWALKTTAVQDQVALASVGATFLRVNVPDVRALRVPIPPLDEQRRIADYLDEKTAEIDALITETERFIELSKERRAALITAAVTGQIDVGSMK